MLIHRKKLGGTGFDDHFRLLLKGGKPEIHSDFKSITASAATPKLGTGAWHHIAASYDGNQLSLYLNGVQLPGSPKVVGAVKLGSDSTPVTLGCEDENGTLVGWLDANLDDVRIYNRSLTDAEIKVLAK